MPRNIAIVGCGAISQAFYLPAMAKISDKFDQIWIVDPNEKMLSAASSIVHAMRASSLEDIVDGIDLVVVASPNATHFTLALNAIMAGKHVLIEKPFVTLPSQGTELHSQAAARGLLLAVNQTRRVFPIARELRQRIANGDFGSLLSVEHFEGVKLTWPFESGAAFAKNSQRTGVIMDLGVHVIDFYQYIIGPTWKFIEAVHDGFDGPEGLAQIRLEADGIPILIRLSRYQTQTNVARLSFTDADVLVDVHDWNTYSISDSAGKTRRVAADKPIAHFEDIAAKLLLNFAAAAEGLEEAFCEAASSLPVIKLLDEIYNSSGRYPSAVGMV